MAFSVVVVIETRFATQECLRQEPENFQNVVLIYYKTFKKSFFTNAGLYTCKSSLIVQYMVREFVCLFGAVESQPLPLSQQLLIFVELRWSGGSRPVNLSFIPPLWPARRNYYSLRVPGSLKEFHSHK